MPGLHQIAPAHLARLVGLPDAPTVLDVRTDEDYARDPRRVPASCRLGHLETRDLPLGAEERFVVVCQRGRKLSEGAAAWLRHRGANAETLEGGFEAWANAGLPLVPDAALPPRDAARGGATLWVTRARPKVDRVACPWLIRRFVDRGAVFLFVPPAEVLDVADRFGATPFDVEGVRWSHQGPLCTFDVMLKAFGLGGSGALARLADIVRGADTARPDLAPEAAGLLAVSLGLSRAHRDDHRQLEAGFAVFDALYRWARDARDETHNWPAPAGALA